jgi:hypothetical protein
VSQLGRNYRRRSCFVFAGVFGHLGFLHPAPYTERKPYIHISSPPRHGGDGHPPSPPHRGRIPFPASSGSPPFLRPSSCRRISLLPSPLLLSSSSSHPSPPLLLLAISPRKFPSSSFPVLRRTEPERSDWQEAGPARGGRRSNFDARPPRGPLDWQRRRVQQLRQTEGRSGIGHDEVAGRSPASLLLLLPRAVLRFLRLCLCSDRAVRRFCLVCV